MGKSPVLKAEAQKRLALGFLDGRREASAGLGWGQGSKGGVEGRVNREAGRGRAGFPGRPGSSPPRLWPLLRHQRYTPSHIISWPFLHG